jgi:hypothetical protein
VRTKGAGDLSAQYVNQRRRAIILRRTALGCIPAASVGGLFHSDLRMHHDVYFNGSLNTDLREFHAQFKTLLETLGGPMMQPGGPVMTAMAQLASAMNSMSQFAAANPEAIKMIALGLGALATALIAIPVGLVLGIPAGITAIAGAIGALVYLEWDKIRGYLLAFNDAVTQFINWLAGIADKIKGLFGSLANPTPNGSPDRMPSLGQPMRFDPGTSKTKATPISLSLNVDGRTLAQSISEQLEQLYEHATGAPAYNGQSHFNRADGGIMGT